MSLQKNTTKLYVIYLTDDSNRILLPSDVPDHKLAAFGTTQVIHSFQASSWGEALQLFYDYCGFGPYNYLLDPETNKPLSVYSEHV